jgi:hypothetical protein
MIEQLQLQKRQLATENAAILKRAIDAKTMADHLRMPGFLSKNALPRASR